MIEINLLPKEERKARKKVPIAGTLLALVFIGAFILIAMMYLNNIRRLSNLTSELDRQKTERQKYARYEAVTRDLQKKLEELEKKVQVLERLQRGKTFVPMLLEDLLLRLPENTWLEHLDMRGNTLTIRGFGQNNFMVSDFAERLERSDFIASVVIEQVAERRERTGADERVFAGFTLVCTIQAAYREASR